MTQSDNVSVIVNYDQTLLSSNIIESSAPSLTAQIINNTVELIATISEPGAEDVEVIISDPVFNVIRPDVAISSAPGNQLQETPNGIYVSPNMWVESEW